MAKLERAGSIEKTDETRLNRNNRQARVRKSAT